MSKKELRWADEGEASPAWPPKLSQESTTDQSEPMNEEETGEGAATEFSFETRELVAEELVDLATRMLEGVRTKPMKIGSISSMSMKTATRCFTADTLVAWLTAQDEIRDETDALMVGNLFLRTGVFQAASQSGEHEVFRCMTEMVFRFPAPNEKAHKPLKVTMFDPCMVVRRKTSDASPADATPAGAAPADLPNGDAAAGVMSPLDVVSDAGSVGEGAGDGSPTKAAVAVLGASGGAGTAGGPGTPAGSGEGSPGAERPSGSDAAPASTTAEGNGNEAKAPPAPTDAQGKALVAAQGLAMSAWRHHKAMMEYLRQIPRFAKAEQSLIQIMDDTAVKWSMTMHMTMASLVPILCMMMLGWQTLLVVMPVCIAACRRYDHRQRQALVKDARNVATLEQLLSTHAGEASSCEPSLWWTRFIDSAWHGWLERWLSKLIKGTLDYYLTEFKPGMMESIEVSKMTFGDIGIIFKHARTYEGRYETADGRHEPMTYIDFKVDYPGHLMELELAARLGGRVGMTIKLLASDLSLAGDLRLGLAWCERPGGPYLSKMRISFQNMPQYSFGIKPFGAESLNVTELPGIDAWLDTTLNTLLGDLLVEPKAILWDVEEWWWAGQAEQVQEAHQDGKKKKYAMSIDLVVERVELFSSMYNPPKRQWRAIKRLRSTFVGKDKMARQNTQKKLDSLAGRSDLVSTRMSRVTSFAPEVGGGAAEARASPRRSIRRPRSMKLRDPSDLGADEDAAPATDKPDSAADSPSADGLRKLARSSSRSIRPTILKAPAQESKVMLSVKVRNGQKRIKTAPIRSTGQSAKWNEYFRLEISEHELSNKVHFKVVGQGLRTNNSSKVAFDRHKGISFVSEKVMGRKEILNLLDYCDGKMHSLSLPLVDPDNPDPVMTAGDLYVRFQVASQHSKEELEKLMVQAEEHEGAPAKSNLFGFGLSNIANTLQEQVNAGYNAFSDGASALTSGAGSASKKESEEGGKERRSGSVTSEGTDDGHAAGHDGGGGDDDDKKPTPAQGQRSSCCGSFGACLRRVFCCAGGGTKEEEDGPGIPDSPDRKSEDDDE